MKEFKREFIQWCRSRVARERAYLQGELGLVDEEADGEVNSDDEDGNRSGDGGGDDDDDDEMLDAPPDH